MDDDKGVDSMKCYKCGSKCITVYLNANGRLIVSPSTNERIVAVRKDCIDCEWHSYPTKVPDKLQ
jgi:hypothetical protein